MIGTIHKVKTRIRPKSIQTKDIKSNKQKTSKTKNNVIVEF